MSSRKLECESEETFSLSLLGQCVLLIGWVMFSVPSVLWGVLIPYQRIRFGYEIKNLIVEQINTGKGAMHAKPYVVGVITGSSQRAAVGLDDVSTTKKGDIINVYVRAEVANRNLTDVTWIAGRSLLCIIESDMQNGLTYFMLAWLLYWPTLFWFIWLGICQNKGIIARILK